MMIDDFTPNEMLDIRLAGVLAGPRLEDALVLLDGFGEEAIKKAREEERAIAADIRREAENRIDELVTERVEKVPGQIEEIVERMAKILGDHSIDKSLGVGRHLHTQLDALDRLADSLRSD